MKNETFIVVRHRDEHPEYFVASAEFHEMWGSEVGYAVVATDMTIREARALCALLNAGEQHDHRD